MCSAGSPRAADHCNTLSTRFANQPAYTPLAPDASCPVDKTLRVHRPQCSILVQSAVGLSLEALKIEEFCCGYECCTSCRLDAAG